MNKVVNMILNFTGSMSRINYLPMRRGEPIRSKTLGDLNKIRMYNLMPKTELEYGLRKTIDWYREALIRGWK